MIHGAEERFLLYIYKRQNKKRCKIQKRMGHESARPRATLAGKISTIAISSLYPSIPFGNSRARHSNLASPDRLASVPFWSHPNVLEFTLEGVQLGWRPDRSEGTQWRARDRHRWQRNFEGWKWEKRIQGWNGSGCGIVERSRFMMMVASPVKANVALPYWLSAATCIPWPFPYGSRLFPSGIYLTLPCMKQFDVQRSRRTASLSAGASYISDMRDTRSSLSIVWIFGRHTMAINILHQSCILCILCRSSRS